MWNIVKQAENLKSREINTIAGCDDDSAGCVIKFYSKLYSSTSFTLMFLDTV